MASKVICSLAGAKSNDLVKREFPQAVRIILRIAFSLYHRQSLIPISGYVLEVDSTGTEGLYFHNNGY